jgi:hypothetical protein
MNSLMKKQGLEFTYKSQQGELIYSMASIKGRIIIFSFITLISDILVTAIMKGLYPNINLENILLISFLGFLCFGLGITVGYLWTINDLNLDKKENADLIDKLNRKIRILVYGGLGLLALLMGIVVKLFS